MEDTLSCVFDRGEPGQGSPTFGCSLVFLGLETSGRGRSKKRAKKNAVKRWLDLFRAQEEVYMGSVVDTFEQFVCRVNKDGPCTVDMVDGDNAWDMIAQLIPQSQALYVAGGRALPHRAPRLRTAGAVCCLEVCDSAAKNAADMMLAFRAGQLAERLRHRPLVRVVSRDGAFEVTWRLLKASGLPARLAVRGEDLDTGGWPPVLEPATRAKLGGGGDCGWPALRRGLGRSGSLFPSLVALRHGLTPGELAELLRAASFPHRLRWRGERVDRWLGSDPRPAVAEMDEMWDVVVRGGRGPLRSPEEEALLRNQTLSHMHGRIPTVALWDARSVGEATLWPRWWAQCSGGDHAKG